MSADNLKKEVYRGVVQGEHWSYGNYPAIVLNSDMGTTFRGEPGKKYEIVVNEIELDIFDIEWKIGSWDSAPCYVRIWTVDDRLVAKAWLPKNVAEYIIKLHNAKIRNNNG